MSHEAQEGRSPPPGSGGHRLLPIAGIGAALVAVLVHLGGGAAVMHLGLAAVLAYFGVHVGSLGGASLLLVVAAVIGIKLLLIFGARRWWHRP
jgi:hypothetical protein